MQNYINQGFAGLNTAVMQVGYDNRFAIADLGYKVQDCCCRTQGAIAEVNYNMERNKCDVLQAFNAGIQRIVDLDTARQLREQERYINTLERRASNIDLVNMLRPPAVPAYPACSPWESAFGRTNNCW
jgi:hypothetical protein